MPNPSLHPTEFALMIGVSAATLRNWEKDVGHRMDRPWLCSEWRREIQKP
jgi:hypothetical protein